MMITGKGKITKKKSGNRDYYSFWAYIPKKIAKNRAFPFRDKEEVMIQLKGEHLEIRRIYNLGELTNAYGIEDATIPKIIENKALANKDKPFIYFRNMVYNYYDVNVISNRIANGLLKQIKKLKFKNPNIALMLPNCPEILFCWNSCIRYRQKQKCRMRKIRR